MSMSPFQQILYILNLQRLSDITEQNVTPQVLIPHEFMIYSLKQDDTSHTNNYRKVKSAAEKILVHCSFTTDIAAWDFF